MMINVTMTSNKMVQKRHDLQTQFIMPFHMVRPVLLRALASKTIKCECQLLIGCQRNSASQKVVFVTLAVKRITPCEMVWKIVLENGVFYYVPFCLRSLGRLDRCSRWTSSIEIFINMRIIINVSFPISFQNIVKLILIFPATSKSMPSSSLFH